MIVYMLFRSKEEEYICDYIYINENNKIYSYSFDEDYIVKSEENSIKDFKQLEQLYPEKPKNKKSKASSVAPLLIKKEFVNEKAALYYLGGSLEDFKDGIPAHKRLPEIVNPYDLDFEEEKDSFENIKEEDFKLDEEDDILDEFNNEDDLENFNDYEDDPYR